MPGLVPGIHVLAALQSQKTWMAGTSPAMTKLGDGIETHFEHAGNMGGLPLAAVKDLVPA